MEQPQKCQNLKPFFFPNSTPSKPLTSISISITILLVISLPIFYISLLHIPPSNLLKDTGFWFLLSNSIIIVIAATDSDTLFSNHDTGTDTSRNIYDEFMLHNKARKQSLMTIVPMEKPLALPHEEEEERRKEVIVEEKVKKEEVVCLEEKEPLGDSVRSELKEHCDYWSMSDEELNRRVEEFIRFNREIMLQEARK
ncbi:hypothetical protein IEQ34_013165 [Dendrobium chrysotoxum]|uniref:DUF4408 domain-containing protein n=1 Tax=Dendrobium chrysotoxum TaxID=161865 RepID=A0AAV7GQQ0_DENCH|nr:hypothetical protein IEQ34_013165 [Dendrobium chrysotoxum]